MAEICLIYGKSGSGKSRSLINFKEGEITLINVVGKRLPFRTKFEKTVCTDSVSEMWKTLQDMKTKVAVIDDAGYIMTNHFMRGHCKGNRFDIYNDIADNYWRLINLIRKGLPEDTIVYIIMHEDCTDTGEVRLRTIGKLLNDKVCIEGLSTICIRSVKADDGYFFITQNQGNDICKSPEGMLETREPNDLKAIDTKIREYYGMN